jgi:ectoine hydroxylase-related dioxygenase (phytanoyl-CoA dioxygenase family)
MVFGILAESLDRPLPNDPDLRADVEKILEHGYVILEDCFSKEDALEAKTEMDRLTGKEPMHGRNRFEGFQTTRIYSLLNKSRVFDKFAILPRILALNDYFLEPGYNIMVYTTIQIMPGEKPQPLHYDDIWIRQPRPRANYGTAVMLAFDDYTADNGATRVIPGSHKWGDRKGKDEEVVPCICPAGSCIFYLSTLWHGGGPNTSAKPRYSATLQYCQPYIRPIENQILSVDPRKLNEIPKRIVDMMGYRTYRPFVGYGTSLCTYSYPKDSSNHDQPMDSTLGKPWNGWWSG